MRTLPAHSIYIDPDRQRKENKTSKDVADLKKSILTKGLLHPPVITVENNEETQGISYSLLAGERRLIAIKELHEDGLEFYYDGEKVPHNETPYTRVAELTLEMLEEAELEENVLRAALTWQEEAAAKLRIHELRKLQNPSQSLLDTAKEIAAVENRDPEQASASDLARSKLVLEHMSIPDVASAKNVTKAYQRVLAHKQASLHAQLARLQPKTNAHKIIHGDCLEIMKTLQVGHFDVILSDPPYGIAADKMKKEVMHNYDDSKENALSIYQAILRTGFNLLKPQGALFLFCDIDHFISIRTMAEQQAFSTWRTPIIWHKGNEGHAPWGKDGFTRTYEAILYAVKGQRGLAINGGPDVRLIKRATTEVKLHAAEKPPELFRWLLQISTKKGDRVLDPCAGTAPIIPASKDLGLEITAIELNQTYYDQACARLLDTTSEAPQSVVGHKPVLSDLERRLGLVK